MTANRTLLIVNPFGGTRRGMAILDQVKPVFSEAGMELEILVTDHVGHARQIARMLPMDGYGSLCVVGGDGTVHEVASGLIERGQSDWLPLGVIPAGTGNDVARQFGIASPLDAARRIVAGRACSFDVMKVVAAGQTDYCLTLVGWAGVADINATAARLRWIGPPRYAVAALSHILRAERRRARLVLDDRAIDDEFLLVAACNTVFTGSGMRLAPRATSDDGKLDVVLLRRASRRQMLRLFAKVFDGSHLAMNCVEYHQVRSLNILCDDRRPLDLDGEVKGTTPVSIQTMPGALRVFC